MKQQSILSVVVDQKNAIVDLCNDGKIGKALTRLEIVLPVWLTVDYGYKVGELAAGIIGTLDAIKSTTAKQTAWRSRAVRLMYSVESTGCPGMERCPACLR